MLILLRVSAFVFCDLGNHMQFKWICFSSYRLCTDIVMSCKAFFLLPTFNMCGTFRLSEFTSTELLFTKLINILFTVSSSSKWNSECFPSHSKYHTIQIPAVHPLNIKSNDLHNLNQKHHRTMRFCLISVSVIWLKWVPFSFMLSKLFTRNTSPNTVCIEIIWTTTDEMERTSNHLNTRCIAFQNVLNISLKFLNSMIWLRCFFNFCVPY